MKQVQGVMCFDQYHVAGTLTEKIGISVSICYNSLIEYPKTHYVKRICRELIITTGSCLDFP